MLDILLTRAPKNCVPVLLLTEKNFTAWLKKKPKKAINWIKTHEFKAKPGTFWLVPDATGKPAQVIAGIFQPTQPVGHRKFFTQSACGRLSFGNRFAFTLSGMAGFGLGAGVA